jgi:hypothetical protein
MHLPTTVRARQDRPAMTGAIGVLGGVVAGTVLYRSARKRMSLHWLVATIVVGALSGLLLGRAATLQGEHTEIIQRGSVALVLVAWWYLVRGILGERTDRDSEQAD